MVTFNSVTPDGYPFSGYPFGKHPKFHGIKLADPDKVFVPIPKIFVVFKDRTHENGMLSLKKQAGFTIVASDPEIGITNQDAVDQIKKIFDLIQANKEIFGVRTWDHPKYRGQSDPDWLVLSSMWASSMGYFEVFIAPVYGDPSKLNFKEDFERKEKNKIQQQMLYDEQCKNAAAKKGITIEEYKKLRAEEIKSIEHYSDGEDD